MEDSSKELDKSGTVCIVIRAYTDGQVEIDGPVDNAVLCYGLLHIAMQKVAEHQAETLRKMTKERTHGGLMNFRRNWR